MPTSEPEQTLKQLSLIISEAEARLRLALHELSLMRETLFLVMRSSSSSSRPTETPIPQLHWDLDSKLRADNEINMFLQGVSKETHPYLYW
jgi:hypothetical protein